MAERLENLSYEMGLISILLNSNEERIIDVANQLKYDDFSDNNILCQGLFEIIKNLVLIGREINPINILAEAEKHSKIYNALGGEENALENINLLKEANVDPDEWQVYVDEIKKYSIGRKNIKNCERLKERYLNEIHKMTLEEVQNEPQKLFLDTVISKKEEGSHIGYGIEKYLQFKPEDIGKYSGILSRFPSVNKATLSYQKKLVYVISGYTNEGKSIFLENEADFISIECGIPGLYIDTEMILESQVQPRFLSIRTGIDPDEIKIGLHLKDQWKKEKIEHAIYKIKDSPLYFVSLNDFDLETIERIVRYYILRYGIQILYFDYIKLPTIDKKDGLNETQKIGNLMDFLKNKTAKGMDLVLLSACQTDEHERTRPADSARIKRFADVLANWRKKPYEQLKREGFKLGRYELEFQKTRETKKPILNFDFNGASSEIVEMDNTHAFEVENNQQLSLFMCENNQTEGQQKTNKKKVNF